MYIFNLWLCGLVGNRRTLGEILNQVKRHWKDNQRTLKDFTMLKRQPKIVLDNITILKNKIKEVRNRLHELINGMK